MAALSILDLVRVTQSTDARGALDNARELAAKAEDWGYRRFWIAEHHNMPGIASAATAVVIAHIAAGTRRIRVGAGGIMLPNHAPIVIAEQFGTLARLHPGRIDLGLGRAPGTDPITVQALRRSLDGPDNFPQDVLELQAYFAPAAPGQRVQAVPAAGTEVPLWILGSSTYGATLAAELGLPYAFASHFAPAQLMAALRALPQPLQALAAGRAALCDDRRQHHRRRQRRRGAAPGDDAADVDRQYLPRRAGLEPPADRRHRQLLDAGGKGAGAAVAVALDRRFADDDSRRRRGAGR